MSNSLKESRISQPERFCKYIHRYCNQTRLDGYDYCIRHILEDKTAPFKQCMYVNQVNKKRCTNAAPKTEKHDKQDNILCPFHTKRALKRNRISHPKKKAPVEGPAALLRSLEHYCQDPVHDPAYNRDKGLTEKYENADFVVGRSSTLDQAESAFEAGEPTEDKAYIENVDDDFSWVEKPSDYLEHAGVYTDKEIITIAREKMLRLQQLYCDELKHIYRQLKEKRRTFLSEMAEASKEENSLASQSKSAEVNPEHLKSLDSYHRCSGVERILRHRAQEKRFPVEKPKVALCVYERDNKKCTAPALVLSNFCKNHILFDPKQVMFKPCGFGKKCQKPIIPYEEKAACDLHFQLPLSKPKLTESVQPLPTTDPVLEPEPFQSMDDIASLGLDAISPGSLFGLDQFGEPGESTDMDLSEDLMQIQSITLNPPPDILSDSRKSESE